MSTPEPLHQEDHAAIQGLMRDYFDGLYEGDVKKLKRVFHRDAGLKAPGYRKTRDEWLEAVAQRPIPRDEGFAYRFSVMSSEIVGEQAMIKASVPLPAADYVDFLGLLKEGGEWKIVEKIFTAV
ncbi:hypothetical protein ABI59_16995 [Acidobacteria bacterium Mor1]|nr:hypothetical protein ABI59_16995 [Acidobacteria bacterium Mor1]